MVGAVYCSRLMPRGVNIVMCLGIPMQIRSIDGYAILKITPQEARAAWELYDCMLEGETGA